MYVVGKGHEHLGPGTSLVQRINWTTGQEAQLSGMGSVFSFPEFAGGCSAMNAGCSEKGLGCGCSGKCGKGCGLGLFDSMDFTTWGVPEWGLIAVGGYLVLSMAGDTKRAVVGTRRAVRRRRSRRMPETA